MGIVYFIAAGGLTLWFVMNWALTKVLRLTGTEELVFQIMFMALGIIGAAGVIWHFLRRKKKQEAAAAAGGAEGAAAEPGAGEEMDVLVREAEARLAKAGQSGKLGARPVIFVVGETGSTKTSTVVNSGLEPELLSGQVYQNNVVAPTRAANLWFARNAVLAEAGGGVLGQPARWQKLVARLRPGRALVGGGEAPRGVVVCFDAETFARPGAAEAVTAASRSLRARLGEISEAFGINLPVYVLFTKMDRLPFFAEYVRNLSNEEATQVCGATVAMRPASVQGIYAEEETARLTECFEQLFRNMCELRPEYLSRENDGQKLPGIYEFPREFRKVRPLVVQFLVDLCRPSQLTVGPFLRGFYFSGVRPIIVTEAAPVARQAEPQQMGGAGGATGIFRTAHAAAAPAPVSLPGTPRKVPQWLFLPHFFNDVVLADRAAMGASGASTKTGMLRRILLASAAGLCLLLCLAFLISYIRNRGLETRAIEAARGITAVDAGGQAVASLDSLKRLETLRQSLETLSLYHREGAPFSYRWGLYVGDDLYPDVRRAYFLKFHQLLFGQTQAGILEFLRALPATPGPEYGPTYDSLKAYLMTTSHHEKSDKWLPPVLLNRWSAGKSVDNERMELARKQFEFYADELKLANPFPSDNDAATVDKARRYLAQFAGVERVYRFMLAEAAKTSPAVNYNKKFPNEAVTANYDVQGPFTKSGWDFMKNALKNADKFFAGERWVLGDYASSTVDRSKLEAELRSRYYSDFLTQWRSYFKAASVVKYAGLKDASQKLNLMSGNQSPLLALFWLASQNTNVDDPEVAAAFQPIHTVVPPASVDRYIAPSNQNYMNALMGLQSAVDQVAGQPTPPNDQQAASTLTQASNARLTTRQLAQAFRIDPQGHIETVAQKLLEDPITYVEGLVRQLGPAELNAKGKALCGQWRALMAKYPFNPAGQTEATMQEVNALFKKPEGGLWTLYEGSLAKALVKQGNQYVPTGQPGINLNPAFVAFFSRAAAFSDAAYPAGATEARLTYTLKPVPTEGPLGTTLRVDGQTITYSGGAAQPKQFQWPGAGPHEAVATVKFGGSDLGWASYTGLWSAFRFFGDAERWLPAGSGYNVEWIVRVGKNPVTLQGKPLTVQFFVDMNGAPPVFQRGYFSGLGCVAEVARP
jgi:type VI secretion system protein ImpL